MLMHLLSKLKVKSSGVEWRHLGACRGFLASGARSREEERNVSDRQFYRHTEMGKEAAGTGAGKGKGAGRLRAALEELASVGTAWLREMAETRT